MHKDPVRLGPELRARVGLVMVEDLRARGADLLILAVARDHVHGLARLDGRHARMLIGHAERRSSHAIRDVISGCVWGRRCGLKNIRDRAHQTSTYRYIESHADHGAWVWKSLKT